MFTVKGYIKFIDETKSGISKNGNSWSKTDFLVAEVKDNEEYEYFFSLWNKSLGVTTGQMVEVEFFIKTTCWNGKYFSNLTVHDVHPMSAIVDNKNDAKPKPQEQKPKQAQKNETADFGDLPF